MGFDNFNQLFLIILFAIVIICFIWRCSLLTYKELSGEERCKRVIKTIIIFIVLSVFLYYGPERLESFGFGWIYVLCILAYLLYGLYIKYGSDSHYSSVFTLIDGILVTSLSVLGFWHTIVGAVLVSLLAFVSRNWFDARKSVVWLIVLECFEAIIISVLDKVLQIDSLPEIALKVVFIETVIFVFNCWMGGIFSKLCKEDVEDYWHRLRGIE